MPLYRKNIQKFLLASFSLPFEEKAAYGLLLDLLCLHDGVLKVEKASLAAMLGLSVRKWNILSAKLIRSRQIVYKRGKIQDGQGILFRENTCSADEKSAGDWSGKSTGGRSGKSTGGRSGKSAGNRSEKSAGDWSGKSIGGRSGKSAGDQGEKKQRLKADQPQKKRRSGTEHANRKEKNPFENNGLSDVLPSRNATQKTARKNRHNQNEKTHSIEAHTMCGEKKTASSFPFLPLSPTPPYPYKPFSSSLPPYPLKGDIPPGKIFLVKKPYQPAENPVCSWKKQKTEQEISAKTSENDPENKSKHSQSMKKIYAKPVSKSAENEKNRPRQTHALSAYGRQKTQTGSVMPNHADQAEGTTCCATQKSGADTTCHVSRSMKKQNSPCKQKKTAQRKKNSKKPSMAEQILLNDMMDLWNTLAEQAGLCHAYALSKSRKGKLRAFLQKENGMEDWQNVLKKIEKSRFLCGDNQRNWRVNIDFVLRENNFIKILEGNYDAIKPRFETAKKTSSETNMSLSEPASSVNPFQNTTLLLGRKKHKEKI